MDITEAACSKYEVVETIGTLGHVYSLVSGDTTADTIVGEEMTRELLGRRVEHFDKSDDDDDCFFSCLAWVSKWLDGSSR